MKIFKSLIYIFFTILLVGCNEQTLLKNLDQNQANEVVAILQTHNVVATKQDTTKEGFLVLVRESDFVTAVNLVNRYGLPSKSRVEIEKVFPSDSLISSPWAEKARLYSAIEQRLEQSLKTINGVVTASLHLSYQLESTRQNQSKFPVHLSAIISYEQDAKVDLMINDVKRFLKNSFADVEYENISVVMTPASAVQYIQPSVSDTKQDMYLWISLSVIAALILIAIFVFFIHFFPRFSQNKEKIKLGNITKEISDGTK